MVTFAEGYISDDPTLRRLEIIEVVLMNCATRMWRMVPEKQRQVPAWLQKVRDAINTQKTKLSAHKRDGSVTPLKSGANGLHVASADTVVCKAPSVVASLHDSTPTPPSSVGPLPMKADTVPADSGTSEPPRQVPTARGDKIGFPTRSPNTDASFQDNDGNCCGSQTGSPLTAAHTENGDVVLVSSSGKQRSDSAFMMENAIVADIPIRIKRLSGGITNELFHVYDDAHVPASVVVRIFGKETERVISRESELFYQSLFVETFVRGGNFLVYEYLDNYETLPFQDMGAEMVKIAERLADFHVRSTVAARLDYHRSLVADASWKEVPVEQERQKHRPEKSTDASSKTLQARSRFEREVNYTRHALTKWTELVTSSEIVEKVHVDKRAKFVALAAAVNAECAPLLQCLDAHDRELGEGACHNDLLSANLMRHRVTGEMKIIDFDYTTRNFLLFDVANHFNEYTGLDCNYARYFPSQSHIRAFVALYRQNMRAKIDAAHASLSVEQRETLKGYIFPRERELLWTNTTEDEEECVDRSVRLVNVLTVCSNLTWAVWSLVQEAVSTLDVDFLEYAETRFRRALETKDAALAVLAANP